MAAVSVFGHVAKWAQLLSGLQQNLSCSNSHPCAFLTFCLTPHHCLPASQIIRLLFYPSDTRIMAHSVPGTLYWIIWVWLTWGIVFPLGCMSICESDSTVLSSCACVLKYILLKVSDWLSDNQSGYFCNSCCAITVTTWMISHSWTVGSSLLILGRTLSVWLSSVSVCLVVFFGRQLVTMFACLPRNWFLTSNFLLLLIRVLIILPLALMRHFGKKLPELVIG